MSVYEKDLIPAVAREIGDLDASKYKYTADELFTAINAGLDDFNLRTPNQQYSVTGTGADAYFSPTPGTEDKRLIALYAALALTNAEIQRASRSAFSHSNPAGSTNLTRIPEMLIQQAERIEDKIETAFRNRSSRLVEEELNESGVELKGRPTEAAEGLGITTIEKTV